MKVTMHINGHYQVELLPENAVELAVLTAMLDKAVNGQLVKLAAGADGGFVVGVEK